MIFEDGTLSSIISEVVKGVGEPIVETKQRFPKKQQPQYLKYTILVIANSILSDLLDMILKMSKPCARVYIVDTMAKANDLYATLDRNNSLEINAYLIVHEIRCISPN